MSQSITQTSQRLRRMLMVLYAVALCLVLSAPIGPASAQSAQPSTSVPAPTLCEIYIGTEIDSTKVKVGDVIVGTLKQSLKISDAYHAPPGSQIIGHIVNVASKRTMANSVVSSQRRFAQDDAIDIIFTELDCADGRDFAVMGHLAKQKIKIPLANGHVRSIVVNDDGQLVHDHEVLKTQVKVRNFFGQYALQVATVASGIATGGIGLLVVPAVMGVAGSMSPSFVTNHPVDQGEQRPRAKGFIQGVISAIPGSGVVQACVCKGDDTQILPGQVMVIAISPNIPTFECTGVIMKSETQETNQQPISTASTHGTQIATTSAPVAVK